MLALEDARVRGGKLTNHRHIKGWKNTGLLRIGPFCWWDKNVLDPTAEPHFKFLYDWKYCLSCNKPHWWIVGEDEEWEPGDDQILDPSMLRAVRNERNRRKS